MRCRLLIASTNKKKLKELMELLSDLPVEIHSLRNFSYVREVKENGKTFRENAEKKALGFARQTGCLTLADDSGLVVDALKGGPGVRSARYAGTEKNDLKNCKKLLEALENVPNPDRTATFQCAVALATPEKVVTIVEGRVKGMIARAMKGKGGFGYDPLFFYPEFGKTFAEISAARKHTVSHRGKTLRKIKVFLKKYLKSGV